MTLYMDGYGSSEQVGGGGSSGVLPADPFDSGGHETVSMTDDLFLPRTCEQIGGGFSTPAPPRHGLQHNISLTPKAQQCDAAIKAAQHRAETIPASPTPVPDIPYNIQRDFLDGLNDDIIATLDCMNSSPYIGTPSPTHQKLSPSDDIHCSKSLDNHLDNSLLDEPKLQPKPQPKSLFEDFLNAGEHEPLVIPPGPVCSTSTIIDAKSRPQEPVSTTTAFSDDLRYSFTPVPNSRSPDKNLTPISTLPLKGSSPSGSSCSLNQEQAEKCTQAVNVLFTKFEEETGTPADYFRKHFLDKIKSIRHQTPWNLYQKYFSCFCQDELDRCMLVDARDCWPSFIAAFGKDAKNFLHSLLKLDEVLSHKETMQQCTQTFHKFCQKVDRINKEGMFHRFQSVTIVVGECINEDAGLAHVSASPGLQKFFKDRLKLEDNVITGLAKCEAL
ncbi:hypothetical protein C0993_004589 [Termitomyces sp. T159_Od127]|nr:hypothetical protein C0993_004589 [Termitomyces sp. T159_Od127]